MKEAAVNILAITNSLYKQSVFVTAARNQPSKIANKILK
jgi:hypothetical protein